MPPNYAYKIMEQSSKRGDALIVTVHKHLVWTWNDAFRGNILISNLINDKWRSPQGPARQMQYTTRQNVYSMYPPITNRPRKEKEPGPQEDGYYFASDAEINYWLVKYQ
ncbi:hypothetical protein RvY_15477 [Ramazzottius varieornatus]|uniref:Uncharacterized protein n=1 Tax=Ramazzottius varieornatus TaxID=947166 RepID=A0A1D1VV19_RAMVA|nr:hypothetical protein RvY_15477 [Ramazzottius varieornatus]